MNQKEIIADQHLIAYCGLYCGACRSYLKGKCPGCSENMKASWCKIRSCNTENNYKSCADCNMDNVNDCKKFNNAVSKIFAVIFNSNRAACISRIRELGYEGYANDMALAGRQSMKRKE